MTVVWSDEVMADIFEIYDYIAADSPESAFSMMTLFHAVGTSLEHHPNRGRIGRLYGTREIVTGSYILTYLVNQERVEIKSIRHGARR